MTKTFAEARAVVQSRASEWGLVMVHDQPPDSRSFGNAFTDFDGREIRLRLALDRGQAIVWLTHISELNTDGERPKWYPLSGVLEFFGRDKQGEPDGPADDLSALHELPRYWTRVVELFRDWQNGKPELDAFFRARFNAPMASN